ncbi:MAG: PEP-CTERM sorting domain-containing protein [bacterium]
MKKVILILIVFSLLSFVSLVNASNIIYTNGFNILYSSLSIGGVSDAQDFLFDSALGTLEEIVVETYSYGRFFYMSVDPPPYCKYVDWLAFYYINQYILKVENTNSGSRMHQESDFGPGDNLCSFNGNGMAKISAGTWESSREEYYDPNIFSFFTLKENDTSVYLTSVINEVYPDTIYDDLHKKYDFLGGFFEGGAMTVYYFYTPVPEPSSCVLLFFGVLGLAAIRGKKKKTSI